MATKKTSTKTKKKPKLTPEEKKKYKAHIAILEKNDYLVLKPGYKQCVRCGKKLAQFNFYKSFDEEYKYDKNMPYCKTCIKEIYVKFLELHKGDEKKALRAICIKLCIYFDDSLLEKAINDSRANKGDTLSLLMKYRNLAQWSIHSYEEMITGLHLNQTKKERIESAREKSKHIVLTEEEKKERDRRLNKFTEEDEACRDYIIGVLESDPFQNYPKRSQKYLYNNLRPYVERYEDSDDKTVFYIYVRLVTLQYEIYTYDLELAQLNKNNDILSDAPKIDKLVSVISKLEKQRSDLCEKNNLTLKNQDDSTTQSGISGLIKRGKMYEIPDIEPSYYEQKKSIGYKHASDISIKSILESIQLTDKDVDDMLKMQSEELHRLQSEVLELKEENRILKIKKKISGDTNGNI